MKRIGIYSGTFDPVHAGHIAFATAARDACRLDEVVFLPEKTPRGKQNVTALSHRVALLEKATENTPELRVMTLKSEKFTVNQTLPELRALFYEAELALLVGSDVAVSLPHWPDASTLLRSMPVIVGLRADDDEDSIRKVTPSATILRTEYCHEASSRVRGGNGSFFNPAMAAYISENALYAN